ncbi:hypothetical protein PQX77_016765 [Marasmius sp. AFHP31]|nr:hypothetical protein PQX77_016765 [Marasmius sp. AFHP31]
MTEALRILFGKRKYVSLQANNGNEWRRAYSLATKVVIFISTRIPTPVHTKKVLDSGIIEVLFFSDERFYELEDMDGEDSIDRNKLSEEIVELLGSILVFLVYGPVIRPFARGSRKLPRSEIVAERSSNWAETLGKAWKNILSKGSMMNDMRRAVEKLLGRCSNPSVSHIRYLLPFARLWSH